VNYRFFAVVFFAADLRAAGLRAVVFLAPLFFAAGLRAVVFFAALVRFAADFLAAGFLAAFAVVLFAVPLALETVFFAAELARFTVFFAVDRALAAADFAVDFRVVAIISPPSEGLGRLHVREPSARWVYEAIRLRRRRSRSLMPPHTPYRSSRRSA
jgi:hypothetical protein